MSDTRRAGNPCEQVARAVACCGAVARLYKQYGGAVQFHVQPTTASVKTDEPVKAPRGAFHLRRTIKAKKGRLQ